MVKNRDMFEFTKENSKKLDEILAKYPPDRKISAVMPLLWLAQEQNGYISDEIVDYLAKLLSTTKIKECLI